MCLYFLKASKCDISEGQKSQHVEGRVTTVIGQRKEARILKFQVFLSSAQYSSPFLNTDGRRIPMLGCRKKLGSRRSKLPFSSPAEWLPSTHEGERNSCDGLSRDHYLQHSLLAFPEKSIGKLTGKVVSYCCLPKDIPLPSIHRGKGDSFAGLQK